MTATTDTASTTKPLGRRADRKLPWSHDDPIIARSALKHGLRETEILAHADELAARFEDYEPVETDEVDVAALTALRDAVAEQARAERHVLDAIRGARDAGMSWAAIGNAEVVDRLRRRDRTDGPDAERIVDALRTSRR